MMHILIDKDSMTVRYKHPSMKVLSELMYIEFTHCSGSIAFIDDTRTLGMFSDLELSMLYKNMCGQLFPGIGRENLIYNVVSLCQLLPVSDLNEREITLQFNAIDRLDHGHYQYLPGSNTPRKLDAPASTAALISNVSYAPVITEHVHRPATPAPLAVSGSIPRAAPIPRAPRDPSVAVSNDAPKQGSKTGRVWEIAEEIYVAQPKPADFKVMRKLIVDACEAEGINTSTASVQFSKWRHTKA